MGRQHSAQTHLHPPGIVDECVAGVGKPLPLGGEVNTRGTTFTLQCLDQLANHIHQFGLAGEMAHRVDLALFGTQHQG